MIPQMSLVNATDKKLIFCCIRCFDSPDLTQSTHAFTSTPPFSNPYDNQFVADCLLDPSQEFQLVHPFPTRNPYIPSIAAQSGVMPTLEEVELVPAALVKFKPSDFGPGGYTGIRKDLIIGAQSLDRLGQQHRPGVQR